MSTEILLFDLKLLRLLQHKETTQRSSTGFYVVMAWLPAVMICSKRSTLG